MPLIAEDVLEEIQARADIAEFIGRYVPLKRAGRHFKALCPFHKEKTPSFTVNTDKQIFHCFGCGVGGNVFGFVMQHDRLTFPEAVRQVADQVGVRLPTQQEGDGAKGQFAQLTDVLEQACAYYERVLAHPQQGKAGRTYLASRGVRSATQKAFRVGLAPEAWDRLLNATQAKQIRRELLEQAGLLIHGKNGDYDRFRNRLLFPIMDARGRVIGFGGRSMDDQEPKYLNSPETPVYHKGRQLFGLAQAKDAIVSAKRVVLVEGYFDCIVLADAGLANVVSPLGTALTEEQVQLSKRYAPEVILAFDADAAGELATLRGIDLLVAAGLHVRVAQLPPGVDPDEQIRAMGREPFERWLESSATIFDVLLATATRKFPVNRLEGRVQAAQMMLPTIAKVPNAMLRSEYLHLLAERLRLDESAVLQELKRVETRDERVARAAVSPSSDEPIDAVERLFIALLLDEPTRWFGLAGEVTPEELSAQLSRRIVDAIKELGEATPPSAAHVVTRLTQEGLGAQVAQLIEHARTVSAGEAALRDCVRRLRERSRKRRERQLHDALRAAHEAGREPDVQRLLVEFQQVVKGGAK